MPRKRRREPAQVERDARAVEHRRNGLTYRQIAAALGFSSMASAYDAVQRGLTDTVAETNDEVRRLELDRLDHLARAALKVLAKPHLVVSQGRVAKHPETGEPLIDSGPVLSAIDRLLNIQARRAKLLGLDSPTKVEMISLDAVDAEIRKLEQELAGTPRAPES